MKLIAKHTLLASILLSGCLAASTASAGKLYKWVDADGNVSYQDRPPPENAKVLDERDVATSSSGSSGGSAKKPDIVIYTVNDCLPCEQMVTLLVELGVPHIQRPLQDDRDAQSRILAETSSLIAPTLFIGDSILQGSDRKRVTAAIKEAGYTVKEKEKPKAQGDGNRSTSEDAEQNKQPVYDPRLLPPEESN